MRTWPGRGSRSPGSRDFKAPGVGVRDRNGEYERGESTEGDVTDLGETSFRGRGIGPWPFPVAAAAGKGDKGDVAVDAGAEEGNLIDESVRDGRGNDPTAEDKDDSDGRGMPSEGRGIDGPPIDGRDIAEGLPGVVEGLLDML